MSSRFLSVRLVAMFLLALSATPALADTLADIKLGGKLIWGGDQDGGGPYVYPDKSNPTKLIGFEVDLAASIATALGVQAEFFQGLWEDLPTRLNEKKIQVVLNGYEWTPERAQQMEASLPYYVYSLQLLVQKDNTRIKSWEALQKAPKAGARWKVGVLRESAAEAYMKKFSDTVEVVSFDGSTTPMSQVETKKLDATLQDSPIAAFYAPDFPKLRAVGVPVGKGYYVIYAAKGETALISELNKIITQLLKSGELEKIYQKYGLWDQGQSELAQIAETGKFLVTTDALGIVSAEGFAVTPPNSQPTSEASKEEEKEGGLSYGGEADFNSLYSWRGIALSGGFVSQPSVWASAAGATFTAWSSFTLNGTDGFGTFQELDLIGEYELDKAGFTITPRLTGFLVPGGSVGEVELELDHDLGPISAFLINSVGFAGTAGSYFGQAGVSYEHEFEFGLTAGASVGLAVGNGIFNDANIGVAKTSLNALLTHAEGTYQFNDSLYARLHVELSQIIDGQLNDFVGAGFGNSLLLNAGLAVGFEL